MSATNTPRQPDFSVAGFYPQPGSDRETSNFNVGWRFWKGSLEGAETIKLDDSEWSLVNLPHGLEVLPLEASGGVNYRGEAWYRKHFDVPADTQGKRVVLHFEGLMGKSKFWVNGKLLKEHFGGFLPAIVDVTDAVVHGEKNVVAVCVDNSDDPSYPPGKPQDVLDFTYFGGIYRDVWMITTDKVHITDPNEVDVVAGGGVFVRFEDVSQTGATVCVDAQVANGYADAAELNISSKLVDTDSNEVSACTEGLSIAAGASGTAGCKLKVADPHLWHVDDPYLYDLVISVVDGQGRALDAVRLRVGIRSIEFKGKEGFFLNGEPFDGKLIGSNRHQDYAYVGNALSNGAHWRDAVLHRQAGMRVIRCAHYPQDPAFMDACDALGMFVIITTPGWQFWNDDPVFEERVFADIRNMVRRDRNRPSALLWEPILNETSYPDYFAQKVHEITHEEYPYAGCYTACDLSAAGQEHFEVVYSHVHHWDGVSEKTSENVKPSRFDYSREERCVFTREWGDCVANWRAQSSPSRVPKGWGEHAQLVQAEHYADPLNYCYTSYESLWATPAQHVGGTLWHGIDHQRGYHVDTFWGGILDATRQPKFSYQMFRSQVPPELDLAGIETGPFVHIAHIMHPVSPADVTVFTNCDEVRLSYNGEEVGTQSTREHHMPHHPVVFESVFRHIRTDQTLEAEGLIDGEVVATAKRQPWDRRQKLVLEGGDQRVPLRADGSDFIPVVARIVDKNGVVVRLTDDTIRFSVEGPATLIGGSIADINPQKLCWGEAVILVRAGTEAGAITVRAESAHPGHGKPAAAELTVESIPATEVLAFSEQPVSDYDQAVDGAVTAQPRGDLEEGLAEVEKQQEDFI